MSAISLRLTLQLVTQSPISRSGAVFPFPFLTGVQGVFSRGILSGRRQQKYIYGTFKYNLNALYIFFGGLVCPHTEKTQ